MGTQTGRGGGGRDVTDGRAHAGGGDRNRDNAMGGGASTGGGFGSRSASVIGNRFGAPSASAQAAAQARNAPTNSPYGGQGGLNARRTANPTPSYDMSLHNMFELSKMMPGVGLPARAGMAIAGYGPDFQGYRGQVNGPGDYDPRNQFGSTQSQLFMPPTQAPRPPTPQALQGLGMGGLGRISPYGQAPGQQLNSGLQGYSTFRPGYQFINGPIR